MNLILLKDLIKVLKQIIMFNNKQQTKTISLNNNKSELQQNC